MGLCERVLAIELVDAYFETPGGKNGSKAKAVTSVLWEKFGDGTIATFCDATVTLAMIWESAWNAGGGELAFDLSEMKAMNKNALRARYERTDFVESLDLDHIRPVLVGHP